MKVLTVQLDVSALSDDEIKELQEQIQESFEEDLELTPILNIGVRVIDPSDYEEHEGETLQ